MHQLEVVLVQDISITAFTLGLMRDKFIFTHQLLCLLDLELLHGTGKRYTKDMVALSGSTCSIEGVVNVGVLGSGAGLGDILVGRGISVVRGHAQGLVNVAEEGNFGTGNLSVDGSLGLLVVPSGNRSMRSWTKMGIVHRTGERIASLAGTKCPLGFVIVIPLGFGSRTAEVTAGKGNAGSGHGRGVCYWMRNDEELSSWQSRMRRVNLNETESGKAQEEDL
jgi:hypothetical protein